MAEKDLPPQTKEAFATLAAGCRAVAAALEEAGVAAREGAARIAEVQRAKPKTPFLEARDFLMRKQWTAQEAAHLKYIVECSTVREPVA